jgi:hypothetical protein
MGHGFVLVTLAIVNGKRREQRPPASDEVIGHIVAMHLSRVASNEVNLKLPSVWSLTLILDKDWIVSYQYNKLKSG